MMDELSLYCLEMSPISEDSTPKTEHDCTILQHEMTLKNLLLRQKQCHIEPSKYYFRTDKLIRVRHMLSAWMAEVS